MTHLKLKVLPQALLSTLGMGVAATLAFAPMAIAQTTGSNIKPATQKVEKIEVTGSNIKRVDSETVSPIQVIGREEIARSGKTTVAELLRSLPIAGTGGLNDITGANSFSSGASTISLRGLGSGATLVLLNGRRIAPFGPADPNFGQASVSNLDNLPLDVVDRVEILKDGASAIYGSEAVAGVVNIILRKDFNGIVARGAISMNKDSEYQVRSASATLGYGDLAQDRYNVFLNVEHVERLRTSVNEVENYILYPTLRDSAYALYRRSTSSFAGSFLTGSYNPSTGQATAAAFAPTQPANCSEGAFKVGTICRWDNVNRFEIIPKSERNNVFVRGSYDFNANLSGFAEASFSRTETYYTGNPQVYGDFGQWYSSTQQKLVNLQEFLPVGHPNNPFTTPIIYRHRFTEVGNGDRQVKAEATRVVAGLKGTSGKYDWEAGVLYSGNDNRVTQFNQIRASVLTNAIRNGTYNFFAPQTGAVKPADIRIDTQDKADSSYVIVDAKVSTELMEMRNGPLGLAAGIEFRKEERNANPDPEKLKGDVVGFGAAFAEGKRNVTSAFAELNVPVFKTLEAQLAFRTDKYSDYGRSTTPKLGLKWKVTPVVALRSSYAEGFRAPSLTEISKSSVTAFTTVEDIKRCFDGTELACQSSVALLLENASTLQPEKSKSYNLGTVIDISKDSSLTVDYFNISRKNEIDLLSPTTILENEDSKDARYVGRVIRGQAGADGIPVLQGIRTFFFNAGETRLKGVDVDLSNNFNLGAYGKLNTRILGTYIISNRGNGDPADPLVEFGSAGFPRFRGVLNAAWEYRDITVGLTGRYNGRYDTARDPERACAVQTFRLRGFSCNVPGNATADMSFAYRGVKNLTLSLVAQNIFDKKPPLDALSQPVNFGLHPFQSTYFTFGATYKFK